MDIDIFEIPRILRRRWYYLAACALVFAALASVYALSLKPSYSSTAQILLDPRSLSTSSSDSRQSGAATQVDPASLDSQIYVVLSSAVLNEVITRLNLTQDAFFIAPKTAATLGPDAVMDATMGALLKHIKVERQGQSLIMTITVDHPVAKSAADIANMVANVYLKQVDEARADAARRASNAFQAQASELRDRVRQAETAVEEFKSANGLATTGETGLVIDQQLAGLNQQLIAARGTEEQQQSIYDQTRNLTVTAVQSGGIPEAVQSSTMGLLRDRYVQLLDRQAEAETSLGANHPQLKAIRSQVASMQQAIQQELDRLRQAMKISYERAVANRKALEQRLKTLTQSSFDSGARQIKMRQLESEAESVRTIYKAFLNRAEELSQEQTISINNSRVITPAIPVIKSVTTLKILILLAAMLFGLAVGSVLAILREFMSPTPIPANQQQPVETHQAEPVIAPAAPAPFVPNNAASATHSDTAAQRLSLHDITILADATQKEKLPRRGPLWFFKALRHRLMSPISTADNPAFLRGKTAASYDHAVASTTGFLLECGLSRPRLNVVFIAAGAPAASTFIADVVQKLIDRDRGVLFAAGPLQSLRPAARSTGRPSLATVLHHMDGDDAPYAPLPQTIRYQRLSLPRAQFEQSHDPSSYSRPTYARFVQKSQNQLTDFIVINACGTELERHLTAIAVDADMIVLLTTADDKIVAADFNRTLEQLGDDANKILGRVLLEAA